MRYLIGIFTGIPLILTIVSFLLNIILASLLAISYTTLTKETPIATITFNKTKNQEYVATLKDATHHELGTYIIYGDQWQLDVGFYKISYFANLLGAESKYTLNRLKGRYKNINDANNKKSRAYQLESHSLVNAFSIFFDTNYGSSTYKDIKLNTLFTIFKTPTGIMVRETPLVRKAKKSYLEKAKSLFGI